MCMDGRMLFRGISLAIVLIACSTPDGNGFAGETTESPRLRPEKVGGNGKRVFVRARLWTDSGVVAAGRPIACFLEFECEVSQRIRYPLIPDSTFRVFVFEADGDYIGECGKLAPQPEPDDRTREGYAETVYAYSPCAVGIRISLPTGRETKIEKDDRKSRRDVVSLGPGEFIIQGIFTDRILASSEDAASSEQEFLRSNWLRVKVSDGENEPEVDHSPLTVRQVPLQAVLTADNQRVAIGEDFSLWMLCVNSSTAATVIFNPYINTHLGRRTAELHVFDERGRYLGELINRPWGSIRRERADDWMLLQPGGFVGRRMDLIAGLVLSQLTQKGSRQNVPAGLYDYQLAYLDPGDAKRVVAESKKVRIEFVNRTE